MLAYLHDWVVACVLVACLIAVVHPRIPTGVFGTSGLGLVMVGLLYSLDESHNPYTVIDMTCGGIGLGLIPILWHVFRRPRRPLCTRVVDDSPETLPPDLRHHVIGGRKD